MSESLTINGAPVETRVKLLWWQERGLSFTRTGYGGRIPTAYQVKVNNRWRRVYCACWSNAGTCYVEGARKPNGKREWLIVHG